MNDLLNNMISFISIHKNVSYLILFLWAMWESLFPISFLIYWEIFFLAWSILAWYWLLNIAIVAPLLIIWWFLGDNISYFLWKKYWFNIIKYIKGNRILWKIVNEKRFNIVDNFFKEKWWLWVLIARFSWPLARITPFLAGSFKLKYSTFIKYDIVWVILGIWLFIFVWYFFGRNFEQIINLISSYILVIIWIVCIIWTIIFLLKKNRIKK